MGNNFSKLTDTKGRKYENRTGFDTLLVHTVNDKYLILKLPPFSITVNALNISLGNYDRKVKT